MKKEQFNNHIKTINKRSMVASIVIILLAFALRFTASPEAVEQYLFKYTCTVLFLLILVHLKANNLKQKAIIRYITDSIGDNE